MFNETIVAALQCANVQDHVDFFRAIKNRAPGFIGFYIRQRCAERKSDYGAHWNAPAAEIARATRTQVGFTQTEAK